jgi:hypothetical protein
MLDQNDRASRLWSADSACDSTASVVQFPPSPTPPNTKERPAMKLSLAIAALAAGLFVGYYVNAEPDSPPVYRDPGAPPVYAVPQPMPAYPAPAVVPYNPGVPTQCVGPYCSGPLPQPLRSIGHIESAVVELAREFGKSLDSAVQDRIITEEHAHKIVSDWALSLAIRKARFDILRVTATLDALEKEAKGLPGSDEIRDLRKLLPSPEAVNPKSELSAKRDHPTPIGTTRLDKATKQ